MQLSSFVTDETLFHAQNLVKASQLQLHQLELSHKILSYPASGKADMNTIYRLLLPHINLQQVSITRLDNELLSEQISKQFLFANPQKDNSDNTLELSFEWRCERHNNPHMDINTYHAELWSKLLNHTPQRLFCIDELNVHCSPQEINSTLQWFQSFTSNCLLTTSEGQNCSYKATRRDLSWFLSFLLTHPSDPAFDLVSEYLMNESK